MVWHTSQKKFRLTDGDFSNGLMGNLNVVRPPYDKWGVGYRRDIYFSSPKEDKDYILITEIRTPSSYRGVDKLLVLVKAISTSKKTSNSIINKVSKNIKALNQKETLEARV